MYEQQGNTGAALSVFISYAHNDEPLRQRLEAHLSLLRRQGLIADWYDRQIMPGAEWAQEIDEHLETASIILLLISADFVASDYCYDKEMKRALERHKQGEARVIPIILRPCDWQSAPFARLQSLPRDGKAITTWQNQDEAFLIIAEGLRRVIERQQIPTRPLSHMERQNRTRLMKRVQATWIEGVLEHSLHQAALIALDLQEQPDALANPWHFEVQETDRSPRPLPDGTSIVQVYDESDGELLILGEPGAGKTTLLLELTRTLLERAEREEKERLPVVFHLSSWAQSRQPFAEWLVEELSSDKYKVPREISQNWIATDQVILLLDGLDEMAEDARPACVQAINAYRERRFQEQGGVLLVVCCRSKEYMDLSTRVTLNQAVTIQPLTDEQIEQYLQDAQGQLEEVRHALLQDPELYKLARQPLMLSILTLAYHGMVPDMLDSNMSEEEHRDTVFATYVSRMLARRRVLRVGKTKVTNEQFKQWLTFLADGMQQRHLTPFFASPLDSMWLEDQRAVVGYYLTSWLLGWLIGGLAGLLIGGLVGLVIGALLVGLLARWRVDQFPRLRSEWITGVTVVGLGRLRGLPLKLFLGLLGAWVYALVFGLVFGVIVRLFSGQFVSGLFGGSILGLSYGLAHFLQQFILRFWLWRAGNLPWNLMAFLDEATDRLLLHEVGVGYIFIHDLLLDYFASLEKKGS